MRTLQSAGKKVPAKGAATKAKPAASPRVEVGTLVFERERMVAEAAYYRAERRGFVPGDELTDWLEAEAEIERHFGR